MPASLPLAMNAVARLVAFGCALVVTIGAALCHPELVEGQPQSSSPQARSALRSAIAGDLAAGCSASELTSIISGADMSPLGKIGSSPVVLASPHGSCICGNVNCPYLALRLDPGGASAILLSTYAYQVTPIGKAQPLPNLRELSHDSALVSIETPDAFAKGAYIAIATARVRGDTGARKADRVPVRFAPGASSAVLTGHVSAGWYDDYLLAAGKGQRVTIGSVHGPAGLTFDLTERSGKGGSIPLKPGVPAALPASGDYILHIDTGSDDDAAYRATLSIR